jgi:hypothetical protein
MSGSFSLDMWLFPAAGRVADPELIIRYNKLGNAATLARAMPRLGGGLLAASCAAAQDLVLD